MRRLIAALFLMIGCVATTNAQIAEVNGESPYARLMEKRLQIDFRNYATEALDLSSAEITAFDPVFLEYMSEKSDLVDQKFALLDAYVEDVDEMTSARMKDRRQLNFIQNFYSMEMEEMELERTYLRRFTKAIGVDDATQFYLLEDAVQNRLKNKAYAEHIPVLIRIERISILSDEEDVPETPQKKWSAMSIQKKAAVDGFVTWVRQSEKGAIWNHVYTARGFEALAGAILATWEASDWEGEHVPIRIENLMKIAEQLKETDVAGEKADIAHAAAQQTANLLSDIKDWNELGAIRTETEQLQILANDIQEVKRMESQSDDLYAYFREAASILEQMSWHVDWNKERDMNYDQR